MKVAIIKGPLFKEREKLAHELLYKIISDKVSEMDLKPSGNKAS
jgi:hypothetical protein